MKVAQALRSLAANLIFKKKVTLDQSKTIPLNTPNKLDAKSFQRHFPAATKEWCNSLYSYNNNNEIKSLPQHYKNLVKLIQSFLNFFHQSENLGVLPSKREYPSGSPKQLILRLRRLSLKKIFVSKAELKYTNSKVVINLLVYNLQLKQLVEEINNRLISFLRSSQSPSDGASLDSDSLRPSSGGFLYIGGRLKLGYEKSPLRPHSFFKKSRGRGSLPPPPAGGCTSLGGGEALGGSTLIASKRSFRWAQAPIVGGVHQRGSTPPGIQEGEKLYSKDARFAPELAPPLVLSGQSLASSRVSPACSWGMGTPSSPPLTSKRDPSKDNNRKLGLLSELELIRFYKLLLNLYENKFNCFIPKLRELLSKIFNRKVELNVVFLKHMYLDSDILTQAVALKLKLRKNRVWRVIKSCLSMGERRFSEGGSTPQEGGFLYIGPPQLQPSPELSRAEKSSWLPQSKELRHPLSASLEDQIQNLRSASLEDNLNLILFGGASSISLPSQITLAKTSKQGADKDSSNNVKAALAIRSPVSTKGVLPLKEGLILPSNQALWNFYFGSCLKNKAVQGIRLETKGRLTKRFTASRSVFKFKWIGSLKNIDSSFKGLSTVVLRGHVRSNVQYSLINSKNRNGAFGVKGWVSGGG